jgi:hypothetical protein
MDVVLAIALAIGVIAGSLWLLIALGDPREQARRVILDQLARGDIDAERYLTLRSAIESAAV